MRKLRPQLLMLAASLCLAGCAAMITKSEPDEPELIQAGTTEAELAQRLGSPIRSAVLSPSRQALSLWQSDHEVSVLLPQETAVSESVFLFKGRLDKKRRVAQAGFDSFMTLGIAELYLIPKALWERATDEELQLTVWFGGEGRALAFKWSPLPRSSSTSR
jgi:hypothetical protein